MTKDLSQGEEGCADPAKIAAVLGAAADRLSEPDTWTQHATARTQDGEVVESDDPLAVCWCACAAVSLACDGLGHDVYWEACAAVAGDDVALVAWNDAPYRTRAQVVVALRQAALAEPPSPTTDGDNTDGGSLDHTL